MTKKVPALVFISMVVLIFTSWYMVIENQSESEAKYNKYLNKAKSCEAKGIYIDALNSYKEVLKLDSDNYEIAIKKADMYYKLGDDYGFINACNDAISIDKNKSQAYIMKADYYISEKQYTEALEVIKEASFLEDDERLEQLKLDLSSKYTEKYGSFSAVKDWHVQGDINYVAVCENNRWGMVLKDGTRQIRSQFDYLGAYEKATGVIPCCINGQYYYVDSKGNRKLVGDKDYQYLGSFGCGFAPAQRDNVYGYIDTDFNEENFEYEYAGAFANNIAAVKKNGKWALINNKFNVLTGFVYDEILMDTNGYCSMYNVIIARKADKYIFINHKGEQIGNNKFDNARLAASDKGYIAVKLGGKWGYADSKGNLILEPKYDDAKSFSLGFAPVKLDEQWGYINCAGDIVIEPEYDAAGAFSSDGSAPVKSYDTWNFIILCGYED